jgi:hypothetical protein
MQKSGHPAPLKQVSLGCALVAFFVIQEYARYRAEYGVERMFGKELINK